MKCANAAVLTIALALTGIGCGKSKEPKTAATEVRSTRAGAAVEPFPFDRFAVAYIEAFRIRIERMCNQYVAGSVLVRIQPSAVTLRSTDSVPNGRIVMFTLLTVEKGKDAGKMAYQVVFCPDPATGVWNIVRGEACDLQEKSKWPLDVTTEELQSDVLEANLWRVSDLSIK